MNCPICEAPVIEGLTYSVYAGEKYHVACLDDALSPLYEDDPNGLMEPDTPEEIAEDVAGW